ncbi:MAG TPA: hypothetical protein VMF67_02205 [Rhizomicrobium sp.]|nr:hypothetical protein [Rhizomicrobium sp.]
MDQLGLMDDGLALGLAGYAPPENVFSVAQKLPRMPIRSSGGAWPQSS